MIPSKDEFAKIVETLVAQDDDERCAQPFDDGSCFVVGSPDAPVLVTRPNGEAVVFVNVYEIARMFGGPEEGGWWYDSGEPVRCILCTVDEFVDVQRRMQEQYPHSGKRYSVLGGEDYDVRVEDVPACAFPTTRPHYE